MKRTDLLSFLLFIHDRTIRRERRGGSGRDAGGGEATADHFFRQQIVRTGGICKSYFSITFHSLLPFLIRTSYYSDLLFSFTDYQKRKSVAAAEEGTPGKEAARERVSFDTDEADR